MHRLLALTVLAVGVLGSIPARADRAVLTAIPEGHDLRVVVRGTTDYCGSNADTEILRSANKIRIVRQRPTRVARCFTSSDVSIVVHDVTPGTYTVTYERVPLVAPARALELASTTAFVPEPR